MPIPLNTTSFSLPTQKAEQHAAQGRLQGFHCDVQEQLGSPESASKNLSQISTEQPEWTVPLAVYWHQRQLILPAVPFFVLRLRNASGRRCFAPSRIATLAHAARPGPTSPGPSAAPGPQAGPDSESESEGQAASANRRAAPGGRAVRSNFNFGVQAGLPLAVAAAAAQAWG